MLPHFLPGPLHLASGTDPWYQVGTGGAQTALVTVIIDFSHSGILLSLLREEGIPLFAQECWPCILMVLHKNPSPL